MNQNDLRTVVPELALPKVHVTSRHSLEKQYLPHLPMTLQTRRKRRLSSEMLCKEDRRVKMKPAVTTAAMRMMTRASPQGSKSPPLFYPGIVAS